MLTSADNAYVFVFEFTNLRSEPAQAQNIFQIQFFQNSVEIRDSGSWSSNGGDQYDLVSAYFNEALQGGTITFGRIFVPANDSPVTIMVKRNALKMAQMYLDIMAFSYEGLIEQLEYEGFTHAQAVHGAERNGY